jgi:hypothetical protein
MFLRKEVKVTVKGISCLIASREMATKHTQFFRKSQDGKGRKNLPQEAGQKDQDHGQTAAEHGRT